ncbi:MAG: hypothetical protein KAV82_12600 [Phycisphaerae bacterium]|nr:hypothetical protein [Phycisphaerae bacterium]
MIEELSSKLKIAGIDPVTMDFEAIPQTNLYRFSVLAQSFEHVKHSERQDLVWRIASDVLGRDEQLCVSMILTLTPDEAGVEKNVD